MNTRRKYGEIQSCTRCGHDIQWHGRQHGWLDRGAGNECLPYIERGEVIQPKGKHTVRDRSRAP